MKITKLFGVLFIIIIAVLSAGCFSITGVHHDMADKIYADYMSNGYYYFEDDYGRSYNQTIYKSDFSKIPTYYTPNEWIDYVQNLKFIDDENDQEIFYDAVEVVERGGGDCEDLAILIARGLHEMGFDTCIIVQKEHVLAGVNKEQVDKGYKGIKIGKLGRNIYHNVLVDDKYYPIESTAKWAIGDFDEKPLLYEKIYVIS